MTEPGTSIGDQGEAELHVLVETALRGDRVATGRLLRVVQRLVGPYCHRRLAGLPATTVEDVLQEIGIAVLEALPRIAPDGAVRPFVFVLARERITRALSGSAVPVPVPQRDARAGRADQLMGRLGDRDREVLTLRMLGGLTVPESATVLGMSEAAVRVVQHRALDRLRTMLTDGAG